MTRDNKQKTRGRIVINRELCKGCRFCLEACPKRAIAFNGSFNSSGYFPARFAHPDRCIGCALCARICPEVAIEVWVEEDS